MTIKNEMKQTKICHVTSAHPRYDVRIFHKQCKSLADTGFDVSLLVNDNLPDEVINQVKIISTNFKPKNRYERMIKSKRIIKYNMLIINADIYHFHDPELLPVALWIKNKGMKVIFDFHEDVSQQILHKLWIPKRIRTLVSYIYKRYEEIIIKKLDALISVTPNFVERLKRINPKTVMITNYPIIANNEQNINMKKKRAICFTGGISSQWNHEYILKAIERIDDIEYILAGSGDSKYIDKLQQLEGWKKVRYLGKIPHEEVAAIYRESIIGMTLLSNDTQVGDEGTLGNTKIFEYMSAGLAVICTNNKIWNEIVMDNSCGVSISPNSITQIKTAITKIISNSELAKEMGINGAKAVRKKYNWSTQEIELVNLYMSI